MIKHLKVLGIYSTYLGRNHIKILKNLLYWKKYSLQYIILDNNSLDSIDFKNLFMESSFSFLQIVSLKKVLIRTQPGIQKMPVEFFYNFAEAISRKNKRQFLVEFDHFSLSKVQRKKFQRSNSKEFKETFLCRQKPFQTLKERYKFFQLSLGDCFSQENEMALRYFGEQVFKNNVERITKLSLAGTKLISPGTWTALCHYLKQSKTLLSLDLANCNLSDRMINDLFFASTLAIRKLSLARNEKISAFIWVTLLKQLLFAQITCLEVLDLSGCINSNNGEIFSSWENP